MYTITHYINPYSKITAVYTPNNNWREQKINYWSIYKQQVC